MKRFAFLFIFLTALLDSIGFGIIIPVLPNLIMDVTGDNVSAAARYGGWLVSVYAICQFVFAPIIGNISDRYGRRPVLLLSLVVVGVNYLVMGLAQSLPLLFLGRVISGVGASTISTCNAYIADISPQDRRAQNFGLIGAAFGMGFVIGPVIGGFLGEFGSRVPFFAAAGLSFANLVFGVLVLEESLKPSHRRSFSLRRANPIGMILHLRRVPVVISIISVMFIYNLGQYAVSSTWSYFTIEKFNWSSREIGYSLGFIGLCLALVQGFLIRLVLPAIGLRLAGVVGMMFAIVAFAGYATAYTPLMLYAAMIPGALSGLATPSMQGIVSNQTGARQQGELQGAITSAMSLTAIVSPVIMTQIFSYFTSDSAPFYFPGAAFVLAGMLTICSLILFLNATRRS